MAFKYENGKVIQVSMPHITGEDAKKMLNAKVPKEFVAKVVEFREGLKSNKTVLTMKVINFLNDWLKKHILGTDKNYSDFLSSKGLK